MSPLAAYQNSKSAATAASQLPEQAEESDVQYDGGNQAGFGKQHSATAAPPLPAPKQGCQHADSLAAKSGSTFARSDSCNYEVPSAQLHNYLSQPTHASHLQQSQIQQDCLVPSSVSALRHCGESQQQGNSRLISGPTRLPSRASSPPPAFSAHSVRSHVMAADIEQQLYRPNAAVTPSIQGPQDLSQRALSEGMVLPPPGQLMPGQAIAMTSPDRAMVPPPPGQLMPGQGAAMTSPDGATVPQPRPDVASSFPNVPARPAAAVQQAPPGSVVHESGTSAASVFSLAAGSVATSTAALVRAPSSRPESVSESDGATRLASLPAPPRPPLPGRGGKTGRAPRSAAKGWTAFTSFGLHARNSVRADNPGVAPAQVEKLVGAMWSGLSAEEKQAWVVHARSGRAAPQNTKAGTKRKRIASSNDDPVEAATPAPLNQAITTGGGHFATSSLRSTRSPRIFTTQRFSQVPEAEDLGAPPKWQRGSTSANGAAADGRCSIRGVGDLQLEVTTIEMLACMQARAACSRD